MYNKEEFSHYVASLAQRAILYEVSTTPKPGLVDRDNPGAHKDMDFFTFMASSSVLYKGFLDCTKAGLYFKGKDAAKLMDEVRLPGIACEKAMFKVTGGVNTHKGIIFSIGVLCATVGKLHVEQGREHFPVEAICEEVKQVASGLVDKDFKGIENKKVLTHGERIYKEYGYKGIRGEVESGFNTVREKAVPIMRAWELKKDISKNDLFIELLMNIMTGSEDTNVIIRGGIEGLSFIKSSAREFLQEGGVRRSFFREKLDIINNIFIQKNLSPGGAADLLAVSIFLGMLEGIII